MRPTGVFQRGGTALFWVAAFCVPGAGHGLELTFPATADLVAISDAVQTRHPVANGFWQENGVPTDDAVGLVQEFTWQITGEGITTAGLLAHLREQLDAQGYAVTFDCADRACGGFDFRHALPVGQAPDMHVDLGDFHYVAAASDEGDTQVALMISRGGATGFVHMALIQPAATQQAPVFQSTRGSDGTSATQPTFLGDVITQLVATGSAPLDDLLFEIGASALSGARYASLITLAAFLSDDPNRRIILVGHTDASGSLAGNIDLSRARARAVQQFLTEELGVDPAQVASEGIGFLAPRAPNTTPEGQETNRRVEVVLATPG